MQAQRRYSHRHQQRRDDLLDNGINKEMGTAISRAYRWKLLAKSLQRRYSSNRYRLRGEEKGY